MPIGVATTYSAGAGYCCDPAASRATASRRDGSTATVGIDTRWHFPIGCDACRDAAAEGSAVATAAPSTSPAASPTATTKALGDEAEARALAYLQRHGLTLVERNYRIAAGPRARGGEIDLVLRDRDGTLVFVEVRARRDASHGGAAASIGPAKRQRLVRAAQRYLLARHPASPPPCRFDVVALDGEGGIDWLRAAFDAAE